MAGIYHDSGDDEDVEKFNITNRDLLNEFDPDRPVFRQTKEDSLYGIWADQDKSGYSVLAAKKQAKYAEPVNFVSGGFNKLGKEEGDGDSKEDVGVVGSLKNMMKSAEPAKSAGSYSVASKGKKEKMDSHFGGFERHTKGIGMKLMQKMGYQIGKGLGKGGQGIVNPIEAHKRQRKAGLGAAGTERTKQSYIHFPTQDSEEEEEKMFKEELTQWKRGGEPKAKKPKYKYKTIDDLRKSGAPTSAGGKQRKAESESRKAESASSSLAGGSSAPPPVRAGASSLSNVKVIDMTGREQKVFSGYHAIAGRVATTSDVESDGEDEDDGKSGVFSCPELVHNIDMLIQEIEQRILANDRQKQYESDRSVSLEHQRTQLEQTLKKETAEISRIETVLRTVTRCEDLMNSDEPPEMLLDLFADVFAELQDKYFAEYRMFELPDLAVVMIHPLLRKYFDEWKPLAKPTYGVSEMKRWKNLFQLDKSSYALQNVTEETDVYQHMLWDVWMPPIRAAIVTWKVKEAEQLLEVIEAWMSLIPAWMLDNILSQLVLPQLQTEVERWNPLTDPVPIHSWVHPWLPHMHERLDPLYATIRNKLTSALQIWHPRDPSARIILEPWHKVFSRGSWDAFVIKTILPKLGKAMQALVVDPGNQDLTDIECVLSWQNLIPHPSLVSLLDKFFFPKWLRALSVWLNLSPDFDEVTTWYKGWKELFPSALLENSFIKDRFKQALEMMNRAVDGQQRAAEGQQSNAYDNDDDEDDGTSYDAYRQPESRGVPSAQPASTVPQSFKHLVQQRAEERGILFAPLPRNQDGHALYRFGDTVIYIDQGVIFQKSANAYFRPVSLQQLFMR